MTSLSPYYNLQGENDRTLIFESRFECGNLMRAIKVWVFFITKISTEIISTEARCFFRIFKYLNYDQSNVQGIHWSNFAKKAYHVLLLGERTITSCGWNLTYTRKNTHNGITFEYRMQDPMSSTDSQSWTSWRLNTFSFGLQA